MEEKNYNIGKTPAEDLKDYIDDIADELNRGGYSTLTFKMQDGKAISHEIGIKGKRKVKK